MTSTKDSQAERPANRRERILEVAEQMARRGGYHGFSFRDVAAAVGVKSASIHHHFPTKEDLAAELASRYSARFIASLGEAAGIDAINRLVAGYRSAIRTDDQMCLCGMFGAEIDAIPPQVGAKVKGFYRANIDWAVRALGGEDAGSRAETLVSGLVGALLIVRSMDDPALFDRVAERLVRAAA